MLNAQFPYEISYQKIGNSLKGAPTIFPYQKTSHDGRWIVKRSEVKNFEELMLSLKRIHLGSNHDHPAILFIRKFYVQTKKPENGGGFLVYEKMHRMKQNLSTVLEAHIESKTPMKQHEILPIAYNLVCALEYLHNKLIPHRNIKPSNILFNFDGKAKLADLTISKGNPLDYQAPEVKNEIRITNKQILHKADMWSLGVILLELCFNQTGIINQPDLEERVLILRERYDDKFLRFLESLLDKDPQQRMSAQNAKKFLENNFSDHCSSFRKESILDRRALGSNIGDQSSRYLIIQKKLEDKHKTYKFNSIDPLSIDINTIKHTQSNSDTISNLFQDLEHISHEFKHINSFGFDANSSYSIDESSVRTISQYSEGYLHQLLFLNLNFKYCEKIDDKAIKQLCQPESHLKKLEELALNFRWCKKVTNVGLDELTNHIASQWKTLRFLTLDFGNCPEIKSDGLQKLSTNFQELSPNLPKKLPNLERLKLIFSGCKDIDDKGFKSLCGLIGPNLPKLQDLSLYFVECSKISVKAFKEFCKHLKQSRNALNNLKLDFTGCNTLTEGLSLKEIKSIRDELTFLQSFELEFF